MATKTDPMATFVAEVNGSCKHHIMAGINGNLREPWMVDALQAMISLKPDGPKIGPKIVIFAQAGAALFPVGVKLLLEAPIDHLKLADELARQLCDKIAARAKATDYASMLRVGDRVAVSEKFLRDRFEGFMTNRAWHVGTIAEINEGDKRHRQRDGAPVDVPWLVALPEVAINVSVGCAEMDAGDLMLCVAGRDAIRASTAGR